MLLTILRISAHRWQQYIRPVENEKEIVSNLYCRSVLDINHFNSLFWYCSYPGFLSITLHENIRRLSPLQLTNGVEQSLSEVAHSNNSEIYFNETTLLAPKSSTDGLSNEWARLPGQVNAYNATIRATLSKSN